MEQTNLAYIMSTIPKDELNAQKQLVEGFERKAETVAEPGKKPTVGTQASQAFSGSFESNPSTPLSDGGEPPAGDTARLA